MWCIVLNIALTITHIVGHATSIIRSLKNKIQLQHLLTETTGTHQKLDISPKNPNRVFLECGTAGRWSFKSLKSHILETLFFAKTKISPRKIKFFGSDFFKDRNFN